MVTAHAKWVEERQLLFKFSVRVSLNPIVARLDRTGARRGYLLHLVVDATYELPLAFEVTKASTGEQPQVQRLLDQMQERHPERPPRETQSHRLDSETGLSQSVHRAADDA